jgi:BRCT domain type II-containing protein
MGGKAKQASPPDVKPVDNTALLEQINQMEQTIATLEATQASQYQQPMLMPMPTASTTPQVDWKERQEQLAAKMKADYVSEESKRHGRRSTISTSFLADEEEPNTTVTPLGA